MIDPGLLVGTGHSDPSLFSGLLNDELVSVDDAEYGKARTTASEEGSRVTTLFEGALEPRAMLTKVKEHTKTTNTILNKKLLKGILCLS